MDSSAWHLMGMFDPAGFRSEAMASFLGSSESRPESISWQRLFVT